MNELSIGSKFELLLKKYYDLTTSLGLTSGSPIGQALESFANLPVAKKEAVLASLNFTLEQMNSTLDLIAPYKVEGAIKRLPKVVEIQCLKGVLLRLGMRMADKSILDLIEEDDVIEIFDGRGVQLFRSWSCFQYCQYSLIDLQLYDWNTLYIRPAWVVAKLFEKAPLLFAPNAQTMAYDLPEYVMTERLKNSHRALLFKMKYASPLLSEQTMLPVAFISTGRLTPVPHVETGSTLAIL